MTAIPADISAGTREATVGGWVSSTMKGRYPGARDAYSPPAEGFFDSAEHAQAAATQRGLLTGVERRRFVVPVFDLLWIDPVTAIPTVRVADAGHATDVSTIPARLELDLDAVTTSLELFG